LRVLITGVTGMVGSHLAEQLLAREDVDLFGTCRVRSRMDNLADLVRAGKLHQIEIAAGAVTGAFAAKPSHLNLVEASLTDPHAIRLAIAGVRPDRIFHLAAQSFVPTSWQEPAETIRTNMIGQVNLFEALRSEGLDAFVHVAGSSEEYGLVYPHEVPISEDNPLRPQSPYAVSKVGQELLALQYYRSYGLRSLVTRAFNHTGPRRGEVFVTSNLSKQIAEMEKGLKPPVLSLGDTTVRRDWSDVRDVARGYWLALEKGQPGEVYNIGSGKARSVAELVELLRSLTQVKIEVRQDPARLRPSDVPLLQANDAKFRAATGWEPQIPFEQTIRDVLDFWRARV